MIRRRVFQYLRGFSSKVLRLCVDQQPQVGSNVIHFRLMRERTTLRKLLADKVFIKSLKFEPADKFAILKFDQVPYNRIPGRSPRDGLHSHNSSLTLSHATYYLAMP